MIENPKDREPIAIIGIGCRFPGAVGPEAFWRLMRDGVDAITEVPAGRFDIDAVYDARPATPGKTCSRWGGFVEGIDQFDPYFFHISPREAGRMDPQQRLLLEAAWEALEDAGQVPARLTGSPTGVFIGVCTGDYDVLQLYRGDPTSIDVYAAAGGARSVASGRVSYALGLQGPSVTVDTACSSSLVAVHLACQSLWSAECTLAVAGGVNLVLSPEPSICFSQGKMLAPDGRCKFGDARANGFVRSDGVGVVMLKPLSRALADRDPIRAVIRGSAMNNDGQSSGHLMAPSRAGQEAVLWEAYRAAGVSPGQVHYVEAHGTGTSVGDVVELSALGAVLAEGRPKDQRCVIGSVKTNIGHSEGAAGIAGLIKTVLCLERRAIPPSLHFSEPNPNVPWQELPLVVQRELGPWPVDSEPARAGVSSFGISGSNAHIVLEEAPRVSRRRGSAPGPVTKAQLLPLSAHSREALEAMARTYQVFVAAEGDETTPDLPDICYSAGTRRTHHDHRLALVGHSGKELAGHLEAFLKGELPLGVSSGQTGSGQPKLVFVFSGQGSQWAGMGRQLMEQEPVFREALERCDKAMRAYADWSLLDKLTADKATAGLDDVDVVQPSIFAVQVALAALWRSWGVVPDAVVGQSLGEVAAAHVAGALSLEDAARIICRRSQLVKSMSGQGGMAAVGLSLEEARRALVGYEDRVSVAVSSSPSSTVLSGDTGALKEVLRGLEQRDIFFRWVNVDYASHSPQMDPLCPLLLQALEGLRPRSGTVPFYSTVTGEVSDGREFDATYWVRNLREPVLFSSAIQRLLDADHGIFLEISPNPILLSAIQQGLAHVRRDGSALPCLRSNAEDERAVMLGSLGSLYTLGYRVDWSKLGSSVDRCVRLPFYPFQRERFWLDDQETSSGRARQRSSTRRIGGEASSHPLLGQYLRSAVHSGTHFWEGDLGTDSCPYLEDHRVKGAVVLPAAAYAEMVLAGATEAFGAGSHALEGVVFKQALFLPEASSQTVQLIISPGMLGMASFQLWSLQAGDERRQAPWTLHATGAIRLAQEADLATAPPHASPEEIQARCPEVMSGAEHYRAMHERGLEYGPGFQGVEQIWRREGEALGRVRLAEVLAPSAGTYKVHPALLDACFQVLAAALPRGGAERDTYLPVGLRSLRLYDRPDATPWGHAVLRPGADASVDTLEGDVSLLDDNGRVVLEALGMRFQRLDRDTRRDSDEDPSDWLYEIQWQSKARPQGDQPLGLLPPQQRGSWLVFTDRQGVGQSLASLLEARGETCVVVSPGEKYESVGGGQYRLNPARLEDFRQLLKDALGPGHPACRGVVHLGSLDALPPDETTLASLEATQVLGSASVLHLVQALAKAGWTASPRLWLITRGAQAPGPEAAPVSIAQSPLWGLGRVISYEHAELRCTMVDLGPAGLPEEARALFQELSASDQEDRIALRGDARYVPRLARRSREGAGATSPDASPDATRLVAAQDQPFRLEITTPGVLDNLTLRATRRREPGPGEIEIRVRAAALNFIDVMKAMGIYPGLEPGAPVPLGAECAGTIAALGEGVKGFQVGDDVVAIAPFSLGSFVTTAASRVIRKPAHLSFEEAAAVPIAFMTAHYALYHLGRLSEGERVLIHSASGGVGLAAVQLARRVGAEIFATAGSPEKRQLLQSLGIRHVMDSRSLAFADEVMEVTGGKGVDVVLNTLTGDAIPKGLSILGPYGRFLEIGKRDIYQNSQLGLSPFKNNLSFSAIDLARVMDERPALTESLLRDIVRHFEDGTYRPLPLQVFPVSEVASAFRHMAQAKHVGKIVVSLQGHEVSIAPSSDPAATFRSDGTYLITGGLGGLGLTIARWMVERGARHLVLTGRSGASAAAGAALDALEKAGARIVVAKADVAQEQQMAGVFADIDRSMPPLRGVIHAAAILDDGILLGLDQARLKSVMAPKISGAWNLHRLTLNASLDFFVLFSSVASLLGSPGQGNYSAANAFLDALAHHRRALGRPGLSINWGPWSEVGLAAAQSNRGARLAVRGFGSIAPDQGVEMLGRLIRQGLTQVGVVPFNFQQWREFYPAAAESPLLTEFAQEDNGAATRSSGPPGKGSAIREALLAVEPGRRRRSVMESHLQEQVGQVLKVSPSRIDPRKPLGAFGLDSLMGVELRNRLQASLGLTLSPTMAWNYPSVADLAPHLARLMEIPLESPAEPRPEEPAKSLSSQEGEDMARILEEVNRHSEEELRQLLVDESLTGNDAR